MTVRLMEICSEELERGEKFAPACHGAREGDVEASGCAVS